MNVIFDLKDEKCRPVPATDGSLGFDVIAYDINFIETITAEMIKTEKQLGITSVPIIDTITNTTSFIEKDQIYQLDSLYRCLVNTGIELKDIDYGYEIKVRAKKELSLKHGIYVADCPAIVNLNGKKIIALIVYNLGSRKYYIKRYDTIGQIVFQKVELPNIEIYERQESTK